MTNEKTKSESKSKPKISCNAGSYWICSSDEKKSFGSLFADDAFGLAGMNVTRLILRLTGQVEATKMQTLVTRLKILDGRNNMHSAEYEAQVL